MLAFVQDNLYYNLFVEQSNKPGLMLLPNPTRRQEKGDQTAKTCIAADKLLPPRWEFPDPTHSVTAFDLLRLRASKYCMTLM